MFSGIVEARGTVVNVIPEPPGCRLVIRHPQIVPQVKVADSISVNGCCLTVVEVDGDTMAFQAGPETLARTNLGDLRPGSLVNLERALAVGDRLGGHFVSGHIDGVGTGISTGWEPCWRARTTATGHSSGSRSPNTWHAIWPPKARSPSMVSA